jgi:hypothetical protein
MNRRRLALAGLLVLVVLSGCTGTGEIPEEDLAASADYDWERNATVALDLEPRQYSAVVTVTNRSTVEFYRQDALGSQRSVGISALQFRYRNGTVVNATEANLSATREGDRTVIGLPAEAGKVGFTASRVSTQFSMPVFADGSYAVRLPPGTRIGVPILSQASPGGYETSVSEGRMTVRWTDLEDGTLSVRYYLQRDLWIFGGVVAIAVGLGVGGTFYYLRQIRRLEEQREELGLDVDREDDPTDDGPPPGMR